MEAWWRLGGHGEERLLEGRVRGLEELYCPLCGRRYASGAARRSLYRCPVCGQPLLYGVRRGGGLGAGCRPGAGVRVFSRALPVEPVVSLGEACTPLVEAPRLGERLGVGRVLLKNEAVNPSGSFIDRGAVVEASLALHAGARGLYAGGLGDFAVSVSAYAAAAGLRATVYLPSWVEASKVYRVILSGASVVEAGDVGEAVERASRAAELAGSWLVVPWSPGLIEGYKTIVYELGDGVDALVAAMGDGVLATGLYKGLMETGLRARLYVARLSSGGSGVSELWSPEPVAGRLVEKAVRETGGGIVEVEAGEIYEAVRLLAETTGLTPDPAGAASIAALRKLAENRELGRRETVVAVVSGAASRDPVLLLRAVEGLVEERRRKPRPSLGETKRRLLELIAAHGGLHPYAAWKLLNNTGHRVSLPTVYQHIAWLEQQGYIKSTRRGRRKVYEVTPEGYSVLEENS